MNERIAQVKSTAGKCVVYLIGWLVAVAAIGGPWWVRLPLVAVFGTALGFGLLWLLQRRKKAAQAMVWVMWDRSRATRAVAGVAVVLMGLFMFYGAKGLHGWQMRQYEVKKAAAQQARAAQATTAQTTPMPSPTMPSPSTTPGSIPTAPPETTASTPSSTSADEDKKTPEPETPQGEETVVEAPKKEIPAVRDATNTATAFINAYVKRGEPKDKWSKGVRPHATKKYAPLLDTVEPSQVLSSKVIGKPTATMVAPDFNKPTAITITVPTDGGVLEVHTVPEGGKWKVSDLAVADTEQG